MKRVERWLWRYRWTGRMVTGCVHMTEEEVKREHPDAVKADGTKRVDEEPETDAEMRARIQGTDTSRLGNSRPE
jgi:hypothetical protein